MKLRSSLFQKLAALPGLNIFNWRSKMERTEPEWRAAPTSEESVESLKRKADSYFKQLLLQDKYIKALNSILDKAEVDLKHFDDIQLAHEEEIKTIKAQHQRENSNSVVNGLRNKCMRLQNENAKLQQTIRGMEIKAQMKISDEKVEQFIRHTEAMMKVMGKNESKDVVKLRLIIECFHTMLGFRERHLQFFKKINHQSSLKEVAVG